MENECMAGQNIPVLPLRGLVIFPGIMLHFDIARVKSIVAVESAMKSNQKIFLTVQKDISCEVPGPNDLLKMGMLCEIKQILRQKNGAVRVLVEGKNRARAISYTGCELYLEAYVIPCGDIEHDITPEISALMRKAQELFGEYLSLSPRVPPDLVIGVQSCSRPGELADYIAANVALDFMEKQDILEEQDTSRRLAKLLSLMSSELDILSLENEIAAKLKETIDRSQREYFLREQMKVISQELGEEDDPQTEAQEYRKKIHKLRLLKDTEDKLIKECDRFSRIPSGSSEANVARCYLDTCLLLPWNRRTKDGLDLDRAEKILNEDHYGLKDVKERILEILAVRKLSKGLKGQIICLVGPPGVGKTSVAKSMARAMGRKYARVSLGGVRDESEIRGHRRTYVGAMPGRIISALTHSGVKNPLILLDEIDKLSKDYHGDPAAALLEALDPEQNNTFYDHYIDLPFDLSEVVFITTANDMQEIPAPLYDRMETITLYSYTHEEKLNIAQKHLIKKQLKKNGLNKRNFSIDDASLRKLIDNYTKEAGVRDLERKLASLMRKAAKRIASGKSKSVKVDQDLLRELMGPEKYKKNEIYNDSQIGIVKGLAWTSVGGETMPIEVALMKGKGKVQVTGSLGDVMKESAQIAVSYIRSNCTKLGINQDFYSKFDIHIHAPEGAVPKDGPSAGVTITTALVSALSKVPVKQDIAMTGEVTLKGKVLPIGGLREKAMAAYRSGVKTVIIPSENESDLEKIDDAVRKAIHFVTANNLDIVFKQSLDHQEKGK